MKDGNDLEAISKAIEEGKSLREILVAMSVWGEERIEKQKASGEEVTLLHTHGGYLNY